MRRSRTMAQLPFYALVFPFSMQQVKHVSEEWALKFAAYTQREDLPSPYTNTFLQEFSGACTA